MSLQDAIAALGRPEADSMFVLTFDDGYQDMYENAFPVLLDKQLPFVIYLTTNPIENREPLNSSRPSSPLSWEQVEILLASGLVTVGAHTHSHPDLRHADAAAIADELDVSNDLIRRRTGHTPRHFAYPWGYWSEAADPLVRARYESAVIGGGGANGADRDQYELSRIPIQLSDGPTFFRNKMKRGQTTEERVRRRLRDYDGPW